MLNVKKDARRIFKSLQRRIFKFRKDTTSKIKERSIFLFYTCYTEGIVRL